MRQPLPSHLSSSPLWAALSSYFPFPNWTSVFFREEEKGGGGREERKKGASRIEAISDDTIAIAIEEVLVERKTCTFRWDPSMGFLF